MKTLLFLLQLIARTEAELNMGLNLALDKCWISARPDDLMPRGREAGELLLVDRGCPAARGVKVIHPTKKSCIGIRHLSSKRAR